MKFMNWVKYVSFQKKGQETQYEIKNANAVRVTFIGRPKNSKRVAQTIAYLDRSNKFEIQAKLRSLGYN